MRPFGSLAAMTVLLALRKCSECVRSAIDRGFYSLKVYDDCESLSEVLTSVAFDHQNMSVIADIRSRRCFADHNRNSVPNVILFCSSVSMYVQISILRVCENSFYVVLRKSKRD